MIDRDRIISFINKTIGTELLEKSLIKDNFANGVQILGSEKINKIAVGVSINEEFLKEAVIWGAQMCIFHHGLYSPTYKLQYTLSEQKRLKLIFNNNLNILGYHYALDFHPKLGNNVQIISKLGAKVKENFADEWGYVGVFDKPRDLHDLGHKCQEIFNHEVFVVQANEKKVKTIGVCSGAHKPQTFDFYEMHQKGIDLLLVGETAEYLPHQMSEEEINYFVCGHYATETFGIKALNSEIKKKFGGKMEIKFIDVNNPV